MATIVPLSHSARWRSRSRGSSMDICDPHHHHDARHNDSGASEWEEEPSDDEDEAFDEPHGALWLVVPSEFANTARSSGRFAPVSPHAGASSYYAAKRTERRRADGSDH